MTEKSVKEQTPEFEEPIPVKLLEWWKTNQTRVIVATVILVTVGIIYQIWAWNKQQLELKASRALDKAANQEQLASVFNTYPGTQAAARAMIVWADGLYVSGQFAQAADAYKKFLVEYPDSPFLASSAQYGYGICLQEQGKLDEAIQTYRLLQQNYPGQFHTWLGQLAMAECYEQKADIPAARKIYGQIVGAHAPDAIARQAQLAARRLGEER